MNDATIRLIRSLIVNVVAPIVGLCGLVFLFATMTPERPLAPLAVGACLVLLGYPIAGIADRKRAEEEKAE